MQCISDNTEKKYLEKKYHNNLGRRLIISVLDLMEALQNKILYMALAVSLVVKPVQTAIYRSNFQGDCKSIISIPLSHHHDMGKLSDFLIPLSLIPQKKNKKH